MTSDWTPLADLFRPRAARRSRAEGGAVRPVRPVRPVGPVRGEPPTSRRAWLAELERKAWAILRWGLDEGDRKAIRCYRETFRRLPDGTIRARPLPEPQPPRIKPIRPLTVKTLLARERRKAG